MGRYHRSLDEEDEESMAAAAKDDGSAENAAWPDFSKLSNLLEACDVGGICGSASNVLQEQGKKMVRVDLPRHGTSSQDQRHSNAGGAKTSRKKSTPKQKHRKKNVDYSEDSNTIVDSISENTSVDTSQRSYYKRGRSHTPLSRQYCESTERQRHYRHKSESQGGEDVDYGSHSMGGFHRRAKSASRMQTAKADKKDNISVSERNPRTCPQRTNQRRHSRRLSPASPPHDNGSGRIRDLPPLRERYEQ